MGITWDLVTDPTKRSGYAWLGETIPNLSYSSTYKSDFDAAKVKYLTDFGSLNNFSFQGSDVPDPVRYYQNVPKFLDTNVTTSFIKDVNEPALMSWKELISTTATLDTSRIATALEQWKTVLGGLEPNINITFVLVDTNDTNWSGRTYTGAGIHANDRVVLINEALVKAQGGFDVTDLTPGTWGYYVILHEIGHTLGLMHTSEPPPKLRDFSATIMDYPALDQTNHIDTTIPIPLTFGYTDAIRVREKQGLPASDFNYKYIEKNAISGTYTTKLFNVDYATSNAANGNTVLKVASITSNNLSDANAVTHVGNKITANNVIIDLPTGIHDITLAGIGNVLNIANGSSATTQGNLYTTNGNKKFYLRK
jgi:hypothetical protein